MFKKNLHLCFSRIHCLPSSFSHPLTLEAEDESYQTTKSCNSSSTTFSSSTSSDSETTTEPDFSSVFTSRRFFVSSPGTSNSILDNHSNAAGIKPSITPVVGGGIPVRKYSPDPFLDFRNSMEEMVRARRELLDDPTAENESSNSATSTTDWEYLHELLLSYLSLNPKYTHKFIVGAFTDLLLSLLSPASEGGGSESRIDGGGSSTREILV